MKRFVTIVLAAFACAVPAVASAAEDGRFALANDCWTLQSATSAVSDGPFFLKPTDLGSYMFYDKNKAFLSADTSPLATASGGLTRASDGGPDGDWRVDDAPGGAFKVMLPAQGKALGVNGGKLALVDPGAAGLFKFDKAGGCADFPEAVTEASGTPSKGRYSFGDVRGLIDAHMHLMAFEFLGGDAHCGKPWDRYGITHAMVDCPDHTASHGMNPLEIALGGKPGHDPVGWPTFKDWPAYNSLTHEGSYWKWLERAWRGGLRLYVNLLVDNGKLCDVYPLKRNPCDEMNTVRLEAADTYKLQDYIDAQYGGPGKGWFRIVRDPFEARKVINDGKLAVILGIENSRLFDCKEVNDVPQCDRATIDKQLDQVYAMGVRDMEIVNKFDNALTGVAGDNGTTGLIVNGGQKLESNHFWDMKTCTSGNPDESDHEQYTVFNHNNDALAAGVLSLMPPGGQAPVYGPGPHCNTRGLTDLGRYLIQRMIDKRMIFDPDHMSVLARKQALDLLEANRYPGVVSSHSWSTPDAYPRIYKLGGFIAPYAGASEGFVKKWQALKPMRDKRYYWGLGYGADMNGFGAQGPPRLGAKNPVKYPFKSFDGAVTLDKPKTGQRTWDINVDGVAQYGLYPDWVQDLRMQAGDQIVNDMARGAEAYLEMWERAVGAPAPAAIPAKRKLKSHGIGKLRLGDSYVQVLEGAGQPAARRGRVWTWHVGGKGGGKVVAVLTQGGNVGLIAKESGRGVRSIAARGVAKKRYLKLARLA
jgi:microsomal dipeptidase-like Zn-dependent dipeptidase